MNFLKEKNESAKKTNFSPKILFDTSAKVYNCENTTRFLTFIY